MGTKNFSGEVGQSTSTGLKRIPSCQEVSEHSILDKLDDKHASVSLVYPDDSVYYL